MNYKHTVWGDTEAFAERNECSMREAHKWALEGRVPAHHRRGEDGGWIFPINREIDIKKLREEDCKVDEAMDRLDKGSAFVVIPYH